MLCCCSFYCPRSCCFLVINSAFLLCFLLVLLFFSSLLFLVLVVIIVALGCCAPKSINEVIVMAVVCQLRFGKVNGLPSGGGQFDSCVRCLLGCSLSQEQSSPGVLYIIYMCFVFRGSL